MSTKMGGINKDERALPKHMYEKKKKKQKGGSVSTGNGGYSGGISSGAGSGAGA